MRAQWIKLLAVTVFAMGAAMAPRAAMADAPEMNIVSPTGTIFVAGPGSVVPIVMTVDHAPLSVLTQFDVNVDASSIIGGQLNPFTGGVDPNQCTAELIAVSSVCTTNGSDHADVTVPWTVTEVPKTYTIFIKTRHQSVDGTDTEDVDVQFDFAVEYPAPPAVANAYINSLPAATKKKFTSGVRGCVNSLIAEGHAKFEEYGPKGGPYDVEMIQYDVRDFSVNFCGGPTI
jgi:hypothetical protein